jgi:hypothetical protein
MHASRSLTVLLGLLSACGDGGSASSGAGSDEGGGGEGGAGATGAGVSTGGSPSNGGAPSTGGGGEGGTPIPPGTIGLFVAQGHLGRTVVSCDAGATWVHDQSLDPGATCWSDGGPECDHHEGSANGLTFDGQAFYATFGWGTPGGIFRSPDGATFTEVLDGTTFGGLASDGFRVVAASREPRWSSDGGATWTQAPSPVTIWNMREIGYAEGTFVVVGNDGDATEVILSKDGGATWSFPDSVDSACDIGFYVAGGIAGGGGVLLIGAGADNVCRSVDGGATWTAVQLPSGFESSLVWTGSSFVAFAAGQRLESPDGLTWTATAITPNITLGAVALSDTGQWVGAKGGWGSTYGEQRFYRSDDGLNWIELDESAALRSHPIRDIQFGRVPESSSPCP